MPYKKYTRGEKLHVRKNSPKSASRRTKNFTPFSSCKDYRRQHGCLLLSLPDILPACRRRRGLSAAVSRRFCWGVWSPLAADTAACSSASVPSRAPVAACAAGKFRLRWWVTFGREVQNFVWFFTIVTLIIHRFDLWQWQLGKEHLHI